MICFCCGSEYDETARESVIDLIAVPKEVDLETAKEVDVIHTQCIRLAGKVLKLCPACTRACAIGIALNSQNMQLMEDLEFEEDEQDADLSEDKPEDETA